MLQRRHAGPRGGDLGRIDLGHHHAGLGAAFGDDAAPRIDHQRMAEGLAAVLVLAALRRGEHVAAVLDGAGAHQHVPVRLAGLLGEGRGNGEERRAGLRQRAVERREAQIVADGQAEPAPRQVVQHGKLAGPIAPRLAIALAVGQIDVEHVDLVVARDDLAARVDQEAAVGRLVGGGLHRQRADVQMDRKLARQLAEGREARVVLLRHDGGEQLVAAHLHDVGHLGRLHVVGAGRLWPRRSAWRRRRDWPPASGRPASGSVRRGRWMPVMPRPVRSAADRACPAPSSA